MRWLTVLFVIGLLAGGCQSKAASVNLGYQYPVVQGPSIDDEIRFYKDRVAERPNNFMELNLLAAAYLTKAQSRSDPGYFELAARSARESLKLQPTMNGGATLILASVAEAQHDFQAAIDLAGEVYGQDPSNLESLAIISNGHLERGELEEARPGAERLMGRAPTSGALNFRARLFMAQGEDGEAERYLLEAIRREQPQEEKTSARSRSLLGELYLRQGQLPKAAKALEAALAIDPKNPFTLLDLGKLAERQGRPAEAADFYAKAYDSSRNPAFLVELARLKRAEGKTDEADKLAAKAEEKLKPELEQGGYGHARDMARLWLDQGKAKEARELLEGELKRRHDVRTRELLAEALFRTGDAQGANEQVQAILATGWKDPVVFARAAQVAEALGQQAPAQPLEPQPSPWPAP